MSEFVRDLNINNVDKRNDICMAVVIAFSTETLGTGKETLASRYTYYAETLEDGRRIYLRCPANLHNGLILLFVLRTQTIILLVEKETILHMMIL